MLQTVNRIKALERMSTCGLSKKHTHQYSCLLYTSPSPRDA